MESKPSTITSSLTRLPSAQHRRQMVQQVWLPLAASILVFLALGVLTVVGAVQGSPAIEKWGHITAIYVILPVLLVGLVIMALVGGGVYGLSKLLGKMPYWMMVIQARVSNIADAVRRISDTITRPIFAVNTLSARLRALIRQVFH